MSRAHDWNNDRHMFRLRRQPMHRSRSLMLIALSIGSVVGASSAFGLPGQGASRWPAAKPSASALQKFDANHDGVLQDNEKAALKKDILQRLRPFRETLMTQYDRNRNGVLDPPEQALLKQEHDARRAKVHAVALARYDVNHNGRLDTEERETMKVARDAFLAEQKTQILEKFDSNHNGTLDPSEKEAIQKLAAAKRTEALQAYDTNRDGRLDVAERAAAVKSSQAAASGAAGTPAVQEGGPTVDDATLSDVRAMRYGGRSSTQGVQLDFVLGRPGNVSVRVFDAMGRLVRTVASSEPMGSGARSVRWDGQGQDGQPTSNGVYWISVEALGKKAIRKVALLR
jgi:Ca2+-binding EF-hand superfamily protein